MTDRLRALWVFSDLDVTDRRLKDQLGAALGRDTEAAAQARLALPLLAAADPAFAKDPGRQARLNLLAAL